MRNREKKKKDMTGIGKEKRSEGRKWKQGMEAKRRKKKRGKERRMGKQISEE